jgi:hypothetical protein
MTGLGQSYVIIAWDALVLQDIFYLSPESGELV